MALEVSKEQGLKPGIDAEWQKNTCYYYAPDTELGVVQLTLIMWRGDGRSILYLR